MVLDTSAIVAILQDEPERPTFTRLIGTDPQPLMSAVTRVECTFVMEGRKREPGRKELELFLREAEVDVVAVTPEQADLTCEAFRRFGKGRHPAALNIGNCFAYAFAKAMREPLLYEGSDFSRTDIASAA
jgi:ribonuclease VapC